MARSYDAFMVVAADLYESADRATHVEELVKRMQEVFTPLGVKISLPSLRITEMLKKIPALLDEGRRGGLTLAPGQIAIFTQTNGENFDTSDTPNLNTTHNPNQPVIHLTLDTFGTLDYIDSKQVLNTGGFDLANHVRPAIGAAGRDHDLGSPARKQQRSRAPNARASARNQ